MAPSTRGDVPARVHLRPRPPARPGAAEILLAGRGRRAPGPGDGPLTIDMDSTICEVHGYHKQGAGYGYTRRLGYHPLLATRADTGEVLHARLRKGAANTGRGAARFVDELVGRVPPRRRQRRADLAGRLGVLVGQGHRRLPPPRGPLLDHRAPDQDRRAPRSPPSPRTPGSRSTTPTAGSPRSPRPRYRRRPADRAPRPPDRRPGPAVRRPGATTPSSPTAPGTRRRAGRRPPPPRRGRARHPRPQSTAPGWRHLPSGGSPPTPPGWWPPPSPTTCCAGPPRSGSAPRPAIVAKTLRRRLLALPGRLTRSARQLAAAPARRLAVGPLVHHGAGSAALHPVPDLTAPRHHGLVVG